MIINPRSEYRNPNTRNRKTRMILDWEFWSWELSEVSGLEFITRLAGGSNG